VTGGAVGITAGGDGSLHVAVFFSHGLDRVNLAGQVTGRQDLRAGASCGPPTCTGLTICVADGFGGRDYRSPPYTTQ
jgi:hypothetical protein